MKTHIRRAALLFLMIVALGCNQRTDKDKGNVILTIESFDGLPVRVSVNAADLVQVEEINLSNIPKDPNGTVSSLMDIELKSFEVTYTRSDRGTRNPPARVRGFFGNVPVGGDDQINNLDILGIDQLRTAPLSDLLFENGGFDKETGDQTIQLNVSLRFFGRTLAGDTVASNIATFGIEFVP